MPASHGSQSNPAFEQTWRDRVRRWKASGRSVRDFCRSEGLSEPSFYSWRRTIAERDAVATDTPAFVPLHVRHEPVPAALELVLRTGHTLRIPPGFDPEHLSVVLAALEAASC
jgi:hypothetical protein